MPARIVVCGSANMDMVVRADELPEPGQTVLGDELITAPGGKGANQAVAAARLGAEVALIARLGRDDFGNRLSTILEANNVAGDYILRDERAPTGVAVIIVDARGENLIAVAPGANARLSAEDVRACAGAFEGAQSLLLQLEVPLPAVEQAAREAKRRGVLVVLNPAPARELSSALLSLVDVVTPNASEALRLTGVRVSDRASAAEAARMLRDAGIPQVIITLGAEGAFVLTGEGSWLTPGFPVQALDTTAAGDAFNAGLAVALAQGLPGREAVRYASAVAALAVTKVGALPSLPYAEDVAEFLASMGLG